MNKSLKLTNTIEIDAQASKVWNALVNPEIIKEYFFGTNVISDFKEGSPIIFKGIWNEKEYEDKGTITKLEEEKTFEYTYWSSFSGLEDKPENYGDIAFDLTEKGKKTELTLTQTGFVDETSLEHSKSNWMGVMEQIKKIVER